MKDKIEEERLKQRFIESRHMTRDARPYVYSVTELVMLADMAERDIWPDGRFSDDECNAWGVLHRTFLAGKRAN